MTNGHGYVQNVWNEWCSENVWSKQGTPTPLFLKAFEKLNDNFIWLSDMSEITADFWGPVGPCHTVSVWVSFRWALAARWSSIVCAKEKCWPMAEMSDKTQWPVLIPHELRFELPTDKEAPNKRLVWTRANWGPSFGGKFRICREIWEAADLPCKSGIMSAYLI